MIDLAGRIKSMTSHFDGMVKKQWKGLELEQQRKKGEGSVWRRIMGALKWEIRRPGAKVGLKYV